MVNRPDLSSAVAGSGAIEELLVVCGPTAAGKTALALALAKEMEIVVVNADSRQIYRGFDIGTAKPTRDERERVPHACLDLADATVRYTAYAWAAEAERAIAAARRAGRTPVVVGGAGFYIRALVHPITPGAPAAVERHRARYLIVDPGLQLRDRIAHRADEMLRNGWPEEVAQLAGRVSADAAAWNASGYDAVRAYVAGSISRATTLDRIVIDTRQYAKRQRTWFRHQLPAERVSRLDPASADAIHQATAWARRPAPAFAFAQPMAGWP